MKVVIDTNVLLSSVARSSQYRPIYDGIIQSKFVLAVSNDIIEEYAEVLERNITPEISENIMNFILKLDNVEKTNIFFKWNFIHKDPDDNKFVDILHTLDIQSLGIKKMEIVNTIIIFKLTLISIACFYMQLNFSLSILS